MICLDVVSIETLDLDISKTDISTVEKISTLQNPSLDSLDYPKMSRNLDFGRDLDRDSRSQDFKSRHLDCRDFLDSLKKDISISRLLSTVETPRPTLGTFKEIYFYFYFYNL